MKGHFGLSYLKAHKDLKSLYALIEYLHHKKYKETNIGTTSKTLKRSSRNSEGLGES